MVVAPTTADVNQMVNSLILMFDQLAKCKSKEELCYKRKDAKIKFKSKYIMPVPPCYIEKIAQCLYVSSDPCAILLPPPLYVEFATSPKQDESNPYVHSL